MKIAKNSSVKGKKWKELTFKGRKLQKIHQLKVRNAKNSALQGEECKEFTLKGKKFQRIPT